MAGLLNTWNALTLQKRIVLIGAVLATLVLVGMVARMATQPTMKLLYGGLDPQTSGEVLAAIEAMNVPVELRGDAIYVPADQKDRVRIELAKDNLPERGQEGYTLLENLSGFGTTSEMFNSALNRALEGELAHTIRSLPGVRSARVHITPAQRRAFQRDRTPPSASVAVRSASGTLSENAANSIQVMVALAVSGLEPQRVAVIDADNGSVIAGPEQSGIRSAATRALELSERHRMELEQMLELHVGEGNARVTVTVETDTDSETIFERRLDPESQVTMNAQTVETTNAASGSNAAVTVASNLPDGEAAAGRDRESNSSETRETFTYQYSETRRDQVKQAGGVKRIGVAVVLNEARSVAEDGA
ncbi:MAG: flagellar basal-body MS-ring/collar protein FliF, partial [Pseudomonadota bacterium]